jgi:hypothetical protein
MFEYAQERQHIVGSGIVPSEQVFDLCQRRIRRNAGPAYDPRAIAGSAAEARENAIGAEIVQNPHHTQIAFAERHGDIGDGLVDQGAQYVDGL